MTKGRKPDPTRSRRKTGNRPQAGESKAVTIPAATSALAAPEIVASLPEPAQKMFTSILIELENRGLKQVDLEAIAMLVHSAWLHGEARKKIAETGILVKGPNGPIVNPLIKVARDEAATYLRLSSEFGLTIASRLRLGLIQLAGESIIGSLNRELDQASGIEIKVKP